MMISEKLYNSYKLKVYIHIESMSSIDATTLVESLFLLCLLACYISISF